MCGSERLEWWGEGSKCGWGKQSHMLAKCGVAVNKTEEMFTDLATNYTKSTNSTNH